MAYYTKLPIVTDGLVYYIDSYNTKSYVSGSTIGNNLKNNEFNKAFLTNGVSYIDGVWDLDGTNQYIEATPLTFLNGISQFSFETMVKFNTAGDNAGFFSIGTSFTNDILIAFDGGNDWWFAQVGNGLDSAIYTDPVDISTTLNWNHLTVVYDGTLVGDTNRLKMYINGVQQTVNVANSPIPATTGVGMSTTHIGQYNLASGWTFDGKISYVRLYDKPLSSDEVIQNYNSTKTRFV